MPFFILHCEADTVTDPEVSRALYERAASTDKTIKLYPGMWHGLTAGEPDENVELVFSEPEQLHQMAPTKITHVASGGGTESPVPAHNRPQRRGSFLCGLGGRPYQQQCRM